MAMATSRISRNGLTMRRTRKNTITKTNGSTTSSESISAPTRPPMAVIAS